MECLPARRQNTAMFSSVYERRLHSALLPCKHFSWETKADLVRAEHEENASVLDFKHIVKHIEQNFLP